MTIYLGVVDISTFFCFGPARSDEMAALSSATVGSSASSNGSSIAGGGDSNRNLGGPLANSSVVFSMPATEQHTDVRSPHTRCLI